MFIIFSLLLSAFFSGMEIAYVSSNRLDLEIEKNKSGLIPKILSIITQNPSRFIATMLIGNNFVLVIYGIFMGQFIMDNIPFVLLDSLNEFTLVLIQTLISTFLILIAAEFIPKVLFQIYSNMSMKIFAIPAYFFYLLLYPITSLVTIISNFILKTFFKVSPDESKISFSKLELENYIENEIENSDENLDTEIEIFQNALELSEIKARDVMVPRAEIIAVDRSIQIQVIDVLKQLQLKYELTYLFISHDLKVIRSICDKIFVMSEGSMVEYGNAKEVFNNPKENYTKKLLDASLKYSS